MQGSSVPDPYQTFGAAGFPSSISSELSRAGFAAPSAIQAQAWPVALSGRDVIAVAKTGSGKTLGFLLPGFLHIQATNKDLRNGPTMLVLAPTRELATQIHDEAIKFGRSSNMRCTVCVGGASKGPQLRDIERGVHVIIATPGRLNDFLEMRKVSMRNVSYLVLDEADRMLDMGFEPQIRRIVGELPRSRQTLLFTATWPKEVRRIAEDFLNAPTHISIGNRDELSANKAITQHVEVIGPYDKQVRLTSILRSHPSGTKFIIFCSTKKMCDQLSRSIGRDFHAMAIHGDKTQQERDYVMSQFKSGRTTIMIATDVAARGLDVKDVGVVVNYDFPNGVEDYIHRIGRTGRAGATGTAYSFFTTKDAKYARELCRVLEEAGQIVPPQLQAMIGMGPQGGSGRWNMPSGGSRGYGGGGSLGGGYGSSATPVPSASTFNDAGRSAAPSWGASAPAADDRARGRDDRGRDGDRGRGVREDSRGGGRGRSRSPSYRRYRSRSRSRSRDRDRGGRGRGRSPSRSRSGSPSPKGRGGGGYRRSRSRSPPRRSSRSYSRSRSRSRSPSPRGKSAGRRDYSRSPDR
eukprot:jgi/Mesvir1/12963/Mv05974-RA.2